MVSQARPRNAGAQRGIVMRRFLLPLAFLLASCTSVAPPAESYDTIIRGGTIVDGSGG